MTSQAIMQNSKVETGNLQLENRDSASGRRVSSFQFPVFIFRRRAFGWLAAALAVGVGLLSSALAYAQGCALCYNTASAVKAAGIQALRHGILILLIPPLVISSGVIYLGYRSRNHFNDPEQWDGDEEPEFDASSAREEFSGEGETGVGSQESEEGHADPGVSGEEVHVGSPW
jgi:hypothetical protein